MPRTFTAATLHKAIQPTFYFIGVTTASSSIRQVFPMWVKILGLGDVEMVGIDLPLHANPEDYRSVVNFIKEDRMSLGALVTTHKIDLFNATSDLFDDVDPLALLMSEVSCLSKKDGRLLASAKDPLSSGFAIDAFAPPEYWSTAERELFIMGAGGSAIAIDWYLSRVERGDARPTRVTVSNRSTQRLTALREVHEKVAPDIELVTIVVPDASDNDAALASMPEGTVIVNATGLGKDAPGSPLTEKAIFPKHSIAWDLNYRGDLVFLDQARAQAQSRSVAVIDGWEYFIHGWTQVISEVFQVQIPTNGPVFDELSVAARSVRS